MPDISKEYAVANRILAILIVILILLPFASTFSERLGYQTFLLNAPSCFVKNHTGKTCPTCGLTHSILSLYKGHFQESVIEHQYGYLFVAIMVIQLCLRIIPLISKKIWIPYADITQMFFCGLIWQIIISINK